MLNPDFRDILSALSAANADFLLVGAYAMAWHGVPRATGDLDVWVRPGEDNAERVLDALRNFGAPMDQFSLEDFSKADWVFQIGVVPRRIDLLTGLSGLTFEEAWPHRQMADLDGIRVPVIDRTSLIRNKKAAGRPKDLGDADELERLPPR